MYFETVRKTNPSPRLLEAVDRAQAAEAAKMRAQIQATTRKRRKR